MSLTETSVELVSIIIPTYNRPEYLEKAIFSVLQQTYQNIEVIVSDDCSSENPQSLVDAFNDPRVWLRRNDTNVGVGLNATYAFKEAKGKYVASLNDDDIWQKDFLEKLVPHLEANPEVVLAFCDFYVIDAEGNVNQKLTDDQTRRERRQDLKAGIYKPFYKLGLIDKAVFCASAAVVRRDSVAWEKLYEAGVFWDYYIVYLSCRGGEGAYYHPEKLAFYRVHEQSENMISGSKNAQAKVRKGRAAIFCFQTFIEDPNLQEFRTYFEKELAHDRTTLAIGLLKVGQVAEARPYLKTAIAAQKFNLRTLVALTLSYIPRPIARQFLGVEK
ncbi:glycosyltransferase family 2 protein [Synechocystis sp. PCC 7509]|uniref:glycosyltransferase family 2 protein n=1 Tax=Synechocystis sp. PCC 7509 TaxID=927677 RepID=UPI0002AC7F7C|nr:glycosyltransferase family 2 protein [Synechocystis sp. PCC 7509]